MFPNGSVITPDGGTLIVAETFAGRLSVFRIEDGERTIWQVGAEVPLGPIEEMLPQATFAPDGITLDAEGHVWAADGLAARVCRIAPGGEIVDEIAMPEGLGVFACQLGGDDGRTLRDVRRAGLLRGAAPGRARGGAVDHDGRRAARRAPVTRYIAADDRFQVCRRADVFVALAAPAAAQASGRDVACGATITSDTKLRADLTNCPGDGLVIGKDGITLDLGRRTIDGTGADGQHGIRLNGRRGVKIKDGTVQEFAVGIGLDASDGNRCPT